MYIVFLPCLCHSLFFIFKIIHVPCFNCLNIFAVEMNFCFICSGRKPGFPAKKTKFGVAVTEPKKEASKPASSGPSTFFVNDGNFMERFKQMQGLALGLHQSRFTVFYRNSRTCISSMQDHFQFRIKYFSDLSFLSYHIEGNFGIF